jgi:hypothetical protein
MERIRPHVKVGSSHDAASGRGALVSRAQRSMKRSGMMRCRSGIVTVRGGPGSAMHRFADARAAPRPGHAIGSDAFVALFTFQTAHLVPAARFPRPGFCIVASLTRKEGGRSAEKRSGARRNTRGACHLASKTRVNALMTRQARRLARRLASHDAGRSPLGAPPWRFWAPGAALPSPWAPAVLQRRAVALRIRAASSSHPGRSAWRGGVPASRGERLRAAAAGRHASLRANFLQGVENGQIF